MNSFSSTSLFTIENSILFSKNKEYPYPKYLVENAELSYHNGKFTERLITLQNSSVRVDFNRGFGYLLLSGKTSLYPGDTYEYIDLFLKEKSYSVYNPGYLVYEFGFLKSGFSYDLLSAIESNYTNFGYEGTNEIILNGIIDYKRLQSFNQLKSIVGSYQNYKTTPVFFLSTYRSDSLGNLYIIKNITGFSSSNSYDLLALKDKPINYQNVGHYRISLLKNSPPQYHIFRNVQNCPDYLKLTRIENDKNLSNPIKYAEGTLTYQNLKIYSEGTSDFKKLDGKLKQMIVSNNPEKFTIVKID